MAHWSAGAALVLLAGSLASAGLPAADGSGPPVLAGSAGPLASMVGARLAARLTDETVIRSFTGLDGIYCTGPDNCWAVGEQQAYRAPTLNQVLHWNGRHWGPVRVPEPGGTKRGDSSQLFSVRCVNGRDCWAVGYYDKNGAELDQLLHWNGAKWSRFPAPTPGGILSSDINTLYDVVCTTTANCWAVGVFGSFSAHTNANQALHWNGKKWSLVDTPDPAGTGEHDSNVLNSVRCSSAKFCLAVGYYEATGGAGDILNQALRWNGKKWSQQITPNPGGTASEDVSELTGLGCSSSSSCWAAGTFGSNVGTARNQILHWNGTSWSQATAPNPGSSSQDDVLTWAVCVSASDCWATGAYGSEGSTIVIFNEALHWNGAKWSLVHTPDPGSAPDFSLNELDAVRCAAPDDCWGVGIRLHGDSIVDEILHWNGRKWLPVTA